MDRMLKNGDYVKTADGTLATVTGGEELLQYAAMRLLARRGEFVYAPAFGSRLAQLSPDDSEKAFVFAQEALSPMLPKVQVVAAECDADGVRVCVLAGTKGAEILVPYAQTGGNQ